MAYNKYSAKLKSVISKINDVEFSKVSNIYVNILESGNYNNDVIIVKDYLKDVSSIKSLSVNDKNLILKEFKDITLNDLGVKQSYDRLLEDYEFVNDSFYSERLDVVKKLINSKTPDYSIIEKVVDIYKTLNSDEVLSEEITKLEEQIQQYGEDIRVFNMIDWLNTWEDADKYKKTISECVENLKSYTLNPNPNTRAVAVESLRQISYNPTVKEFINYLVATNLSDPQYNLQKELPGSMATDRTYDGGYLEQWHTGKVKHGLGTIVQESLNDAYTLLSERKLSERSIINLLLQRVDGVKLNNIDEKFINGLKNVYSTYDLGLFETLQDLRKNSVITKTPQFQKFEKVVLSGIESGLPDKKFINEAYSILQSISFDEVVSENLKKLNENFENVKDRIIFEDFVDYLNSNNRLNLYEGLINDLKKYIDNPNELLKESIYNSNIKTAHDQNVKNFLNYLNSQTPNKNRIVNTDPSEFSINKVYGLYEKCDNGEHFVIDGSYLIKDEKGLRVANENNKNERLDLLSKLMENLNVHINEGAISGFAGKDKYTIKLDENNQAGLYVNGKVFEKDNINTSQSFYANNGNIDNVKNYITLQENFELFTEFDNIANQITYRKNPGVRVNIVNMDGNYNINFINENIGLNKWSKTSKYETLKSKLVEFMGFDISESFQDNLNVNRNEIDTLKENAQIKHKEIMESETQLDILAEKIKTIKDVEVQSEGYAVYESFQDNLNSLKSEYRKMVDKIMNLESKK